MAETCSRCGGKSDYDFAPLCRNCERQLEQRASEVESAMGLSSPQELGTFLDSLDKLEDAEERIPPDDYVDMLDELVKVYAALAKGPPHLSTPYGRALLLVEPRLEFVLQERQQEKESKKKEQRKREEERRRRQLAKPHRHALEQREKVFLELVEKNPAASAAHLELARFYVRNGDRLPGKYPQEWGVELLLKAAHAYVKAIALGFRDKEREAAAKVEFAELGKDFYHLTSPGSSFVSSLSKWRDKVLESVDEMGLDFLFCSELKSEWDNIIRQSVLEGLELLPSGGVYAREAEQILRQLLRRPISDELPLLELLLRAVLAQGNNAWEGADRPRGWSQKVATIEARIAEVKMRRQLEEQAKATGGKTNGAQGRKGPGVALGLGDEGDYGPEWPELSREVRDRDGHRCAECGATDEELHVHHIIPLSQGGTHDPDNLITLCRRCHANMHPHMSP